MDIWVTAAGGEASPLTTGAADDEWPFWSPDGRWVLFYSDRPGGVVWRVPAGGGEVAPFLEDGWNPVWSPGRGKVYFVAQREGRTNLYERTSGSTRDRRLTDFVGKRGSLDTLVDTDGEFLYFTWREDEGDLWVMDVHLAP
jgi:Tol biopolymer transport system component